MKKILAIVALFFIAQFAFAADIQEGKDFQAINPIPPKGVGDQVEVVEFFMFTCPHCYHLEPTVESWLKSKPANVTFERIPAMFGGVANIHAKAFYALEAIGELDRVQAPLFDAIHEKKQKIATEQDMEKFLESQKVDLAKYRSALTSFTVETKSNRAAALMKRYGIKSVPTMVVDGRYRAQNSGQVMQAVDFLVGKTLAERSAQ